MALSGIATDDTHYPAEDVDAGWVMVRAAERTREAVVQALRDGAFYASAGPELWEVTRDKGHIEIVCSPCFNVHVHANRERGWFAQADHRDLHLMSRVDERDAGGAITRATFDIDDPEATYFRIVVTDAAGRKAWPNVI